MPRRLHCNGLDTARRCRAFCIKTHACRELLQHHRTHTHNMSSNLSMESRSLLQADAEDSTQQEHSPPIQLQHEAEPHLTPRSVIAGAVVGVRIPC